MQPTLTSLSLADVHVNSGACRSVPMTAYLSWGPNQEIDSIDVQIWRGSTYEDNQMMTADQPATDAHGYWYWCPHLDGLGKFRAGPSEIDYFNNDTNDSGVSNSSTTTTFMVKQSSIARESVARAGSYVTVKSRVRFFSVADSAWVYGAGATLALQKRARDATTWATVAHAAISAKTGVATFAAQRSVHAAYWRVRFLGTWRTWASTSGAALK